MVAWGTVSLCMAWATTATSLYCARFFLGMAEAGFVPGILYYLTLFYKRSETSLRMATFLCFNILAGSTGGLLAAAISNLDGVLGLRSWQWVFVAEAIPTLLLAVLTWFFLPPSPAEASFLTVEERQLATNRILFDCEGGQGVNGAGHGSWKETKELLLDVQMWLYSILVLTTQLPAASIVLFMPSLVKDLGFTAITAQLMTAPPYAVAAFFGLLLPWWSDRIQVRGIFIVALPLVSITGYLITAFAEPVGVRYFGIFLVLSGVVGPTFLIPAWLTNNIVSNGKRASALAMIVSTAGIGGLIGSQVYRESDAPRYPRENKRRDSNQTKGLALMQFMSEGHLNTLGDKHPKFRYTL
ncbi:hypothetical protein DFQ26_008382 [Actinomortierella ambigua]|nr:hypothetical protein DFQ26_008382 [Actinomortierella ambigua]